MLRNAALTPTPRLLRSYIGNIAIVSGSIVILDIL